ncbi:hypothetical protein FJY70_04105 [candidate division WOR-3 bacterium]|nr:hypothetical protein [candidate division WOR-3 bacterium]
MARIKSIRQRRPEKKFRIPSSAVQWGIVGAVAVVLVVLVVGALSRPPADPGPIPLLSTATEDLISLTRMLGDVGLDSVVRSSLGATLGDRLTGPDSLLAQRQWSEAITALNRLLGRATHSESAAVHALAGLCYYEADLPDRSLQSFRKSLAADTASPSFVSRLRFYIGWLFQSRGYQDSALAYYSRLRPAGSGADGLLAASAGNNAGVAYEVLKETTAAMTAYREALALLDTLAYAKQARTVKENLARVTRARAAP